MGKGRRDYTWGVLQDSILPGRFQVNFYEWDTSVLVFNHGYNFCLYKVPAGYRLFLVGVTCTASLPGINELSVNNDLGYMHFAYFDLNYVINFGDIGSVTYEAGDTLRCHIKSCDPQAFLAFGAAYGVLEELV